MSSPFLHACLPEIRGLIRAKLDIVARVNLIRTCKILSDESLERHVIPSHWTYPIRYDMRTLATAAVALDLDSLPAAILALSKVETICDRRLAISWPLVWRPSEYGIWSMRFSIVLEHERNPKTRQWESIVSYSIPTATGLANVSNVCHDGRIRDYIEAQYTGWSATT